MHGLVLTAAGTSSRFGGSGSKVLADLCGRPVIAHALAAFRLAIPGLDVVVTGRPEDLPAIRDAVPDVRVIAGGATRQASVACGVAALRDDVSIILVHDAARPLIQPHEIQTVLAAAEAHGAAIAAAAVPDTIHRTGTAGTSDPARLTDTLDRETLVAAQTPQAAQAALLRMAIAKAAADGHTATDEAGLLQHAGYPVVACRFSGTNLKITTALDLEVARKLCAAGDHA